MIALAEYTEAEIAAALNQFVSCQMLAETCRFIRVALSSGSVSRRQPRYSASGDDLRLRQRFAILLCPHDE